MEYSSGVFTDVDWNGVSSMTEEVLFDGFAGRFRLVFYALLLQKVGGEVAVNGKSAGQVRDAMLVWVRLVRGAMQAHVVEQQKTRKGQRRNNRVAAESRSTK